VIPLTKPLTATRRKSLSEYVKGPPLHGRDKASEHLKNDFHHQARLFCFELARELRLRRDSYDVRNILAGPQVTGEIDLHTSQFFMQITHAGDVRQEDADKSVMVRRCAGLSDYGGPEEIHYMPLEFLDNVAGAKSWILDFLVKTRE
jgi:hypothetical protein